MESASFQSACSFLLRKPTAKNPRSLRFRFDWLPLSPITKSGKGHDRPPPTLIGRGSQGAMGPGKLGSMLMFWQVYSSAGVSEKIGDLKGLMSLVILLVSLGFAVGFAPPVSQPVLVVSPWFAFGSPLVSCWFPGFPLA